MLSGNKTANWQLSHAGNYKINKHYYFPELLPGNILIIHCNHTVRVLLVQSNIDRWFSHYAEMPVSDVGIINGQSMFSIHPKYQKTLPTLPDYHLNIKDYLDFEQS